MAPTGKSSDRGLSPRFRQLAGRGIASHEVELGSIVGVFGVRGELRVHLHNREGSVLLDGPCDVVLVAPDGARSATRLQCRSGAGKRILGRLDGLTDRDVAAAMKGTRIVLARQDLPETDEGEFYVTDLQGLRVVVGGEAVGRVVDVHNTTAGDLIELRIGDDVHFLPFSDPAVGQIDLQAGTLEVDPEGLEEGDEP